MLLFVGITLILWGISVILLFASAKEKTNLWYSGFIFFLSLGYPVAILKDFIIPNAQRNINFLNHLSYFLCALSFRFCPYFILQAGISWSDFFKPEIKKQLTYWLLLPVILTFILDLIYPQYGFLSTYLDFSPLFWTVALWGIIYGTFGNYLFFHAYHNEPDIKLKRQKLLVLILTLPTLASMIISYGTPILQIAKKEQFNMWPVILIVLLFVFFIFRYGVLGVQLKLEKQYFMNDTIKAISFGASIINHAVKNETLKISICAEDLKKCAGLTDKAAEDISIIHSSIEHILNMMARIQGKTQEIIIYEQIVNLTEVIENAINSSKPFFERKNILVKRRYLIDLHIRIDKAYIQDVLFNILKNAVEAVKSNGQIEVVLRKVKKEIWIEIRDNGTGISKENLPHVFEPFFSTKSRQFNYGLGLSYCYNVMQKHNGTIEIISEENQGTQVILKFPFKRVANLFQLEGSNG